MKAKERFRLEMLNKELEEENQRKME